MAELDSTTRAELWREWMADLSRRRDSLALAKGDLAAAINALDTWVNTNAATINAAIPQPARGVLSTAQKAELLMLVVAKRYVKGA